MRGFSPEELEESLTDVQILPILQLFAVADDASLIHGLPKAPAPRCGGKLPCPASAIDTAYTALRDPAHRDDGAYAAHFYATSFAPYQRPTTMAAESNDDLRLLFRAAHVTAGENEMGMRQPGVIADMRRDLDELQRRGLSRDHDWRAIQDIYVADREFEAARTLARMHPARPKPPPVTDVAYAQTPSMLTIDGMGAFIHQTYDVEAEPGQIIVIAGCHFAAEAAKRIEADATLSYAFQRHALWLAPQMEALDEVRQWNAEHANQPIHVAWRNTEWPMLDDWSMPSFYVFHDGVLVGKVIGYQPEPIRKLLHQAQLTQ